MLRNTRNTIVAAMLLVAFTAAGLTAQELQRRDNDDNNQYRDRTRIDRYLDVEIWTNHDDGDFYVGDNVHLEFRTSRDAFVAIYSIDTRGKVNLLFPSGPGQDNFIEGGQIYDLPGKYDDYDLVVSGPEGVENIQIIASRERFSIPDWFKTSGLLADWEDRFEYMDFVNSQYFVRYEGQRFAYNRTAIYVNEWEPTYFQPVYYPDYPYWTTTGNIYFDYPWGASIYINGIYWGCAPLYIPRIYAGWHTVSIYDSYGYGWESDIHVNRYHTVILDRHVVKPLPTVRSKYKEVRQVGYRNPVTNGYPKYASKVKVMKTASNRTRDGSITVRGKVSGETTTIKTSKRHVRGNAKLVKTSRGYETSGSTAGYKKRAKGTKPAPSSKSATVGKRSNSGTKSGSAVSGKGRTSGKRSTIKSGSTSGSSKSSVASQRKSGSSNRSSGKVSSRKSSPKKSATVNKQSSKKSGGSRSSGKVQKQSPSPKKSSGKVQSSKKYGGKSSGSSSIKQGSSSKGKSSGKSGRSTKGGKGRR